MDMIWKPTRIYWKPTRI